MYEAYEKQLRCVRRRDFRSRFSTIFACVLTATNYAVARKYRKNYKQRKISAENG